MATVLVISVLPVLLFSGWQAFSSARLQEQATVELIEEMRAEPKSWALLKRAGEFISFGQYQGYSEWQQKLIALEKRANSASAAATEHTAAFWVLALVTLLVLHLVLNQEQQLIFALLLISTVALTVGLFAPIITISGHSELPVLGEVVVLFQSKAIVTTIETVWRSGNYMVGSALFLFSVLIPLLKTLAMSLTLFPGTTFSKSVAKAIKRIGKWSMADVFVVALLLTYFTLDRDAGQSDGIATVAELQVGLYFFLGYVLLSMLTTHEVVFDDE